MKSSREADERAWVGTPADGLHPAESVSAQTRTACFALAFGLATNR